MPDAVLARHERGQRRFIVHAAAVLLKAQRHRLQVRRAGLARERNDGGGVDTGGQKRSDRNIGDHVIAHRFEHRVVHDFCAVFIREVSIPFDCLAQRGSDRKILHRFANAVRIDVHE